MSWSSTLALNREENKDSRPVIGLRLTEETLAALRRGDSCTLVFEQGEAFLHVGEAVFRLDRRTLAVDREVREVYQVGTLIARRLSYWARNDKCTRTTPVSQLDPRRNRRQPSAGSSMEALTPQQIAARSANTTARSPARLSASGVKSSTYGVDSPAAQAAALAAVAANQATMAPKRHATPLRTRLLKLLAMGPTDIGALQTKLAQRPEAFTVDLTRLTDRQGSVYYLKPECYQDVQIYEWDYTDEERAIVVALAQQAFDQLGLPENARERIMLLAPDERPAGWDHKGTLRERVIHALALKPMEFKQAQERAGATEDDSFRETLRQDASYREVQVDTWPGWSEEERKKVAATMRSVFASTGLSESDPVWDRLSNYPSIVPSPPPPPSEHLHHRLSLQLRQRKLAI
ncbi:hypothetical protein BDF22DRAFT_652441 [Syncephalis plumigaleata]|nr:hypothetical protein BDF22DRAFT_652441 [Syncephalis plumigaleata]